MRIATEPTERNVIISGMGESHLEIICDRLLCEFKISIDVGKPKVIYRETIRKHSEQKLSTYDKWAGAANTLISN